MDLNFIIIPTSNTFLETSYDIQDKLKHHVATITIDNTFDSLLNTRINKWRKQLYNIIVIDEDYPETNSISIFFSDKGSRRQVMEIEEFIDLVVSFTNDDSEQQGNCIIS